MTGFLSACERAKTCMMLAVIFYHSMLVYAGIGWFGILPVPSDAIIGGVALWLNTIHIWVFTFASGYLYQYLRFECERYSKWRDLLRKKCKRLLLPYGIVSVVWCIPFSIFFFLS